MLLHRPGQSHTEYVNFICQSIDDYNETREIIDGLATIRPHHLGLLTLRGSSSTC
jgi:hypothetical protein